MDGDKHRMTVQVTTRYMPLCIGGSIYASLSCQYAHVYYSDVSRLEFILGMEK